MDSTNLALLPFSLVLIAVFPSSDGIPQRNRLDFVDLNLPLENFLDLTFIRTVFHLLPTNHVKELWCQDKVSLHRLRNNRKSNISERKGWFRDSLSDMMVNTLQPRMC